MDNQPTAASAARGKLQSTQVYALAGVCLIAGLGIGYVSRGTQSSTLSQKTTVSAINSMSGQGGNAGTMSSGPAATMTQPHAGHAPTLADMQRMADAQAAPLLEKLKSDPNNTGLLLQVGGIYHSTHQFKQASLYYGKAAQADPKNVVIRTKLASSLYRDGDANGAIAQLNQGLSSDPKNADALFDLGMIKLQGKGDSKGALAAWQKLLKTNPGLSEDRKAMVLKLMADVLTTTGDQRGVEGARSDDGHK